MGLHASATGWLGELGAFLSDRTRAVLGLIIDMVAGSKRFFLLPDGYGYVMNHALYYVPAVVVTALLVYWLGRTIDRRR